MQSCMDPFQTGMMATLQTKPFLFASIRQTLSIQMITNQPINNWPNYIWAHGVDMMQDYLQRKHGSIFRWNDDEFENLQNEMIMISEIISNGDIGLISCWAPNPKKSKNEPIFWTNRNFGSDSGHPTTNLINPDNYQSTNQ